jgi:ADP-L-glycero-D-manno-heptose 6-epimerase
MSRIVVTGGAGFIGRNLVAALNERGEEDIVLVDRLGAGGQWRNLLGLRYADYLDKDDFRRRVREGRAPDAAAVFHLGACSSTTETDADYLADNNYRYSREVCEWALAAGARFVYASSAATYGDGSQGYRDDDAVTPTLRPLNMYGYSKHMFDLWALRSGAMKRIAGLKYFNVFGPGEDHKGDMRSVVRKAFDQINETGIVKLFCSHREDVGDGEQTRDFVYVDDAVRMTLFFRDRPEVSGLFNAGTGAARTWNDLARAVFAAMGIEVRIEYIDMPEALRRTYQYHTEADMTKMRAAGWTEPAVTLEEGVMDYVRSYLLPAPVQ